MKKVTSIVLSLVMSSLLLAGCGSNTNTNTNTNNTTTPVAAEDTVKIGFAVVTSVTKSMV